MTVKPVPINQEQSDYTAKFHKISTHLGTIPKFSAPKGWYEEFYTEGPQLLGAPL